MSSSKKETPKKAKAPNKYSLKREHHRNWLMEGSRKIKSLSDDQKAAKKIVNAANAAERLKEGNGATYIDSL